MGLKFKLLSTIETSRAISNCLSLSLYRAPKLSSEEDAKSELLSTGLSLARHLAKQRHLRAEASVAAAAAVFEERRWIVIVLFDHQTLLVQTHLSVHMKRWCCSLNRNSLSWCR